MQIKKNVLIVIISMLLAVYSWSIPEENAEVEKFTLESALSQALTNNPLVERTRLELSRARLLEEEVKSMSLLPEFSLDGQFGAVPEARGDIFYSPDRQSDLTGWGPFFKFNLKIAQPLFTFGRISSARQAARGAVDLQNIKNDSEIEKMIFQVLSAYWALSAARQAESVAGEVQENYGKLVKEVEERLDSDESEIDDTDLLEIKSNRYQIEEIVIRSRTESRLAEGAFNTLLGREPGGKTQLADEAVPGIHIEEKQVTLKIARALEEHRDIKGLKAAVRALNAKTNLAYSKKRPMIALAGGLAYAYAPHRDDQTNPFVIDDFNYFSMGAFFTFEWDLNSLRKNVEASRYNLERKAMEQNLILLRKKIQMEILRAAAEVKQNARLLDESRKSLKSAKSWLRLGMDNWDMGIGEVDRLIKAYNAFYLLKGIEIKRTLELNISLVKLAYILGNTRLYLEWVKHGQVKII